jgi:hypothetical protein
MNRQYLYLLMLAAAVAACQPQGNANRSNNAQPIDLQKELPGIWEAVSVTIDINSAFNQTDSSFTIQVSEKEWLTQKSVKPVKTFFQTDNRYRQEFRNAQDSLLSLNRGIWNTFGDTLMMIEPTVTYQYTIAFKNGLAAFSAFVDGDGDGFEDDEYLGVYRKISDNTQ